MRALGVVVASLCAAISAGKKNVLFLMADDMLPIHVGPRWLTPNLNKLASQGTEFRNAHSQFALCSPSRISIMTGILPGVHKQEKFGSDLLCKAARGSNVKVMNQVFKENGYDVRGAGKIYHDHPRDSKCGDFLLSNEYWTRPFYLPFSKDASTKIGERHLDKRVFFDSKGNLVQKSHSFKNNPMIQFIDPQSVLPLKKEDYLLDYSITEYSLRELKAQLEGDDPFFHAMGLYHPHMPFVCSKDKWDLLEGFTVNPPTFFESIVWDNYRPWQCAEQQYAAGDHRYDQMRKAYWACVADSDDLIGRVLSLLENYPEKRDNTVVLFSSDHGYHLAEHTEFNEYPGGFVNKCPNRDRGSCWSKNSAMEGATAAPLIVRAPGLVGPRVTYAPVELIDIFPTLVDLAGLGELQQTHHGTSLRPILDGSKGYVKPFARSYYNGDNGRGMMLKSMYMRYHYPMKNEKPALLVDYKRDPHELSPVQPGDKPVYQKALSLFIDAIGKGAQQGYMPDEPPPDYSGMTQDGAGFCCYTAQRTS